MKVKEYKNKIVIAELEDDKDYKKKEKYVLKREKCDKCGVVSLGKSIHKNECWYIKEYGYFEVTKL